MTGLLKQSKRSGFTKWEFLVVVCVVGILTMLFLEKTRHSKGPVGRKVPLTSPNEENRISHPSGLSFVAPPNWDSNLIMEFNQEVPRLSVAPRVGLALRYQRANFGCRLIGPPQEKQFSDWSKVQFQGFPAYERMVIIRKDSFDAPACSVYDLRVNREGQWWRISYEIADETTTLPPVMREYFDAIRFPPKVDEEAELSPELEQQ